LYGRFVVILGALLGTSASQGTILKRKILQALR
jgi:hypothetical protein